MIRADLRGLSKTELADRVCDLESKLAAIEGASKPNELVALQEAFNLSKKEAEYLHLLSDGVPRNKRQMLNAIYADDVENAPELKIVDVLICRLRKKINRFGVDFETIWGSGYILRTGLDVVKAAKAGKPPTLVEELPRREAPERLVHEPTGAGARKALAELIRRCDENGRVIVRAREFAGTVRLKKNLRDVFQHLEQKTMIRIESSPDGSGADREWVINVAQHLLAGRK